MTKVNHSVTSAEKRKRRVRAKINGTTERPRLTVFRSNKATYLQVIDDSAGTTLAAASTRDVKAKKGMTKTQKAEAAAEVLAERLKKVQVKKLVFDRGGYRYHGRVKAVADAVRAQGFEL
jgi:large subunit ribosomal protein L18